MGLYRDLVEGLERLDEQRQARPLGPFLRALEIRVKIIRALREANYWRAQALKGEM